MMADNPIAYMLADYVDEVCPVNHPSLDAWADWLSKPDHEWSREDPASDGQTFRVSRTEVAGLVRAKYLGEGKWTHDDAPEGCTWFAVLESSWPPASPSPPPRARP